MAYFPRRDFGDARCEECDQRFRRTSRISKYCSMACKRTAAITRQRIERSKRMAA